MGQETFEKKEREKKKRKNKQEKAEKREERKSNNSKGKSLDDMMAYLDENGNITSTPPKPGARPKEINVEDILLGPGKQVDMEPDAPRTGVVAFFNDAKGYGFINDQKSQDRIFVHANQLSELIKENDKVTYEVEHGPKGYSAVNVKKI